MTIPFDQAKTERESELLEVIQYLIDIIDCVDCPTYVVDSTLKLAEMNVDHYL